MLKCYVKNSLILIVCVKMIFLFARNELRGFRIERVDFDYFCKN